MTLVDESTFAISDTAGDMVPGGAHGLFVRDTRVLSRLELRIDGRRLEGLAAVDPGPLQRHLRLPGPPRRRPGRLHPARVPVPLRGPGDARGPRAAQLRPRAHPCLVEGFIDADFADLFAVKEGGRRRPRRRDHPDRGRRRPDLHLPPGLHQPGRPGAVRAGRRRNRPARGQRVGAPHLRGPRGGSTWWCRPGAVGRPASRWPRSSSPRSSILATAAANRSSGPSPPSGWPSGASGSRTSRPTTAGSPR